MGQSKKAMLKYKGQGEKLLFDDEGKPHKVYEMRDVEEEFKERSALDVARDFAEDERGKLKEADVQDKALAKEKRKEKKRKRKEREREVSGKLHHYWNFLTCCRSALLPAQLAPKYTLQTLKKVTNHRISSSFRQRVRKRKGHRLQKSERKVY